MFLPCMYIYQPTANQLFEERSWLFIRKRDLQGLLSRERRCLHVYMYIYIYIHSSNNTTCKHCLSSTEASPCLSFITIFHLHPPSETASSEKVTKVSILSIFFYKCYLIPFLSILYIHFHLYLIQSRSIITFQEGIVIGNFHFR